MLIPGRQPSAQGIVDLQFSQRDEFVNKVGNFAKTADSGNVGVLTGGEQAPHQRNIFEQNPWVSHSPGSSAELGFLTTISLENTLGGRDGQSPQRRRNSPPVA